MNLKTLSRLSMLIIALSVAGGTSVCAADKKGKKEAAPALTEAGSELQTKYADELAALRAEIEQVLPKVSEQKIAALAKARAELKAAEAAAEAAKKDMGTVQSAKALVDHAKGKWIGGAEKGIAAAQAALKKAKTDAERTAAQKDLAKWEANKADGIKALKERQAAYEKAKVDEEKLAREQKLAQDALAKAKANEEKASADVLADVASYLNSDKNDEKLVKASLIAQATPAGLAAFAQQGADKEALIAKLLSDNKLMKEMLEAGGAGFAQYGRAIEIYTAIQQASSKAKSGMFQRLALATALEHAKPITQSNPKDRPDLPTVVDPVKRYLHYEQAFEAGELDPAFKNFSAWEYRMVVDCDASDDILQWGRDMLRNYRPDHISNPNYGWRYSAAVKTEVPYGSENVKCALDSLHNYQNIVKDGGVCGRRAFFGRFILKSFGIPTWGVTQHKHAALSHWTPKGWLINLGAGFQHSWWDKDEDKRSGLDFLLESQARVLPDEYLQVLRAKWTSHVLGEPQYNERRKVEGGFWSSTAHYQARAVAKAAKAEDLGPLGQELAEANEPQEKDTAAPVTVSASDRTITVGSDGVVTIPSVAFSKKSGRCLELKSYLGGMQINCAGGFGADYEFDVPRGGKYALTVLLVTVQEKQVFEFYANSDKKITELAVPYTIGKWELTKPIEISLESGKNVLHFASKKGSRGVSIKEFKLTPIK